jgi:hypothetical protein
LEKLHLFLHSKSYLSFRGVIELKLREAFVGILSLSLLAACGQAEPGLQGEPAAEEAAEDDFPDLILPDNE